MRSLLASIVLAALASSGAAQDAGRCVLFRGGLIRVDEGRTGVATALLACDGRVVAAGDEAEVLAHPRAGGAARVDLGGATAVPGLQDAHGKLEPLGEALESVDLRGADEAELVERVARAAASAPRGSWILGYGWDAAPLPDGSLPHHAALSARVPDHPVFLASAGGGEARVNRAALRAAELDGEHEREPEVSGGRVPLDAEGRATGVLLGAAAALVRSKVPPPDRATRVRRILLAQELLLASGLTAVHDMGTAIDALPILAELRDRGLLSIRVVAYVDGGGVLDEKTLAGLPLAPDDGDVLSAPGVAFELDGGLGPRAAALIEPYADAPAERGSLRLAEADLGRRLALCVKLGLQPAIGAVGDRANRIVLDAYEKLSVSLPASRALRPRVEHAQVVAARDWPRFPALGVVPSMQPVRAAAGGPEVEARLGPERSRGAHAWRALAPELKLLAFGSGFPEESPNPLLGLHAARARTKTGGVLGEHGLDGAAALAGFTSGAAHAARQDDRRGRLAPGYAADLTVLDVDPVRCAPEDLLSARVTMTVVNGRVVFRAR